MPGFPTRISRTALGPTLQDRKPVVNPEKEVGKAALNLAFWQIAGLNVVSPVAVVLIDANGLVLTHSEVWDPNRTTSGPTVERLDSGWYSIEYATEYNNEQGTPVTISLMAAAAFPQTDSTALFGTALVTAANACTVKVWNAAGAPADCKVLVVLY